LLEQRDVRISILLALCVVYNFVEGVVSYASTASADDSRMVGTLIGFTQTNLLRTSDMQRLYASFVGRQSFLPEGSDGAKSGYDPRAYFQ
jgi:hypothetical protein